MKPRLAFAPSLISALKEKGRGVDLYTKTSYELSRHLTLRYSTSFGKSTKLFSKNTQPHIFAIYGLVRVADEIVDTYTGNDKKSTLNDLENETYHALKTGYSANPLVHAFAHTANQYGITKKLIAPFFKSMRLDLKPHHYTQKLYATYIYGSAEVIGLMCLKVFTRGNTAGYKNLEAGARALGAAYQKVNFLRDFASDFEERGRVYFPGVTFDAFDETAKQVVIDDISDDFSKAKQAIIGLPRDAKRAVGLSYVYYGELLKKLDKASVATIKASRIRVSNTKKIALLMKSKGGNAWQK